MPRIPGFEVVRELGEGGMSSVYLCRHNVLDKLVAVKILHEHLARRKDIRNRFISEAKLMSQLKHPNIVRVLDFLEFSDRIGFVMEYVEGKPLDELIGQEYGPIPHERALPIFRQVLEGMGYAHEHGVVHRDLKPSNVIVTDDGTAKITDFGIAKLVGEKSHTQTGAKMGTLYYMSPEQIRDTKGVDHRSDIYSLGMTLYEMLAGRLPFEQGEDTSEFEVMNAITGRHIPPPREFYPHIPEWLETIVLKSLALKPADRFESCANLLDAIAGHEDQNLGFREMIPSEGQSNKNRLTKWKFLAGAAAAIVLTIFGIELFPSSRESMANNSGPGGRNTRERLQNGPCSGMAFIDIPAGSFMMGSPQDEDGRLDSEGPQHEVTLEYSFQIMDTEVTQGMWEEVMGSNFSSSNPDFGTSPDYPAYGLDYYQCRDFIYELNRVDHDYAYRLPSEAEWEYACRAGTATPYYDDLDSIAAYSLGREGGYMPVASKKPNQWGLYDMSGSACEWCEDDWHDNYHGAPADGSAWLMETTFHSDPKVTRGGYWNMDPANLRSSSRFQTPKDSRDNAVGLRIVRIIREEDQSTRWQWTGEENVVLDKQTELEWLVGPNEDIYFAYSRSPTAEEYLEQIADGNSGWRYPTVAELMELYESNLDETIWGPIYTEAWFVWSSEMDYSNREGVYFFNGNRSEYCSAVGGNPRVLLVR